MESRETARSLIQMTFEGMMVLFVKNGGVYCDVGLLKHAPNHIANLLVTRIPRVGAPEILLHLHDAEFESRLWLDVQKREPLITLYTNSDRDFQRDDKDDVQDFRWVVNFEGPQMYARPVGKDPSAFRSFLRINDGTFYTQQLSSNELILLKPRRDPETIGQVAVRIRCEIALSGSEVAFFSNGADNRPVELPASENVDYGIYLSNVRHEHEHSPDHSPAVESDIDAENYNTALAVDQPPSRKIHFDRSARATPDAACFPPTSGPPGY